MSKTQIINKLSRSIHKVGFGFKKHSPEILVGAGVIGVVASTVMACKATTKVYDILEEDREELEKIHAAGEKLENGEVLKLKEGGEYGIQDYKKDLTIVYAKRGLKFVKLYGPSILVGALSITSILTGHNILRKRNLALAAAYATVDKGFKEYRDRVVERFGKELDKELRYNIKAQEVDEIVIDEKTGEEKIVTSTVNTPAASRYSDYARCFDQTCEAWTKNPELNLMFLKRQEDYLNDRLQRRGHLFLNEVYDALGFKRTVAGNNVGWIYDEKHPTGDNYVDLGLYNLDDMSTRRFVNGLEACVWIDPNVDGDILHSGNFEL